MFLSPTRRECLARVEDSGHEMYEELPAIRDVEPPGPLEVFVDGLEQAHEDA